MKKYRNINVHIVSEFHKYYVRVARTRSKEVHEWQTGGDVLYTSPRPGGRIISSCPDDPLQYCNNNVKLISFPRFYYHFSFSSKMTVSAETGMNERSEFDKTIPRLSDSEL